MTIGLWSSQRARQKVAQLHAGPTLEVTYRHGEAWAAYLFLRRESGQRPARSRPVSSGVVIDFAKDGTPLGVEITAPHLLSMALLNAALRTLGVAPVR